MEGKEESDPLAKLIPVETRASKVRVHFGALLLGVFLAQFQVNHIPVFLYCCSFKPLLLLPYPATLFTFIEHINMIDFFIFLHFNCIFTEQIVALILKLVVIKDYESAFDAAALIQIP